MSKAVPNQAVNQDVHLPRPSGNGARVERASELSDGQLWLLYELWLKHGLEVTDRCYSLFQFHPTDADRLVIGRRVAGLLSGWGPWVGLYRGAA